MRAAIKLLTVLLLALWPAWSVASTTPTLTPTITPTASPTPTVTPTAVCGSTFGRTAVVGTCLGAHGDLDKLTATQFHLPVSGTVYAISVYFTTTNGGNYRMGIYSDVSGAPGTLQVQSSDATTVDGWNSVAVNLTFLAPGDYWVAQISQPVRDIWDDGCAPSGATVYQYRAYGVLPASLPNLTPVGLTNELMYASYCPGPPIFYTPTPTASPTPTPLVYRSSGDSTQLLLGPVPAVKGVPVCLYYDQPPSGSTWDVYNIAGQRVSTLRFGLGEQACWDTSNIAPGVYLVRVTVNYVNGDTKTVTRKVVVVP